MSVAGEQSNLILNNLERLKATIFQSWVPEVHSQSNPNTDIWKKKKKQTSQSLLKNKNYIWDC